MSLRIFVASLTVAILVLAWHLDRAYGRLNKLEKAISQNSGDKMCPLKIDDKDLLGTVYKDDVRGIGTGLLTCYYKKAPAK